jgi:hypothetical protein
MTHARLQNHLPSAFAGAVAARVDGLRRLDRGLGLPQGGLSSPPWPMRSNGRRRVTSYMQ